MILDLKKLRYRGKTEESFFFEYSPSEDLITIPNAELVLPVKVQGKVYLTGSHACFIEGEICYTLKGECTRCLTLTEKDFIEEFSESVEDGEKDSYPMVNDSVDLSKIVDDKIIMSLPFSFLCKEDCKGICPTCLQNLNDGKCNCKN